jgi:putative hydrolase of the HAD superfamily
VEAVLFDLFGVIARHQSETGREELAALAGAPAGAFQDAYWALRPPYDSGELTGREYWREVAAALGTAFDDRRTAALVEAGTASWSAVDGDMVALVGEPAFAGRRIALLSTIPREPAARYEEHHPWLEHFEVRALSCRIGRAKPHPEAYRWCYRALGLAPGGVLFVDDREENVRAAEAVGMRGHLFTGPGLLRAALGRPHRGDGTAGRTPTAPSAAP